MNVGSRRISNTPKSSKFYKTAAMLLLIAVLLTLAASILGFTVGVFVPIGMAFILIGVAFWQRSRKLKNNEPSR